MARLKLTNISKTYGATKALRRGNMEIDAGEVHVLIGSNGSGKSTLCKIIGGSVAPDSGEVILNDILVDVSGPGVAKELGIGVFYQELSLSDNRTIAQNICLADLPVNGHFLVDKDAMAILAQKYISLFKDVCGEGFSAEQIVSGLRADQQQLVEIMKTLATEAEILIFDEPTSALDRAQVQRFFEILRELKQEGRSIIFISHRMDEIFEIGDRVSVIRDGETVTTINISDTSPGEIVMHMVGQQVETSHRAAHEAAEDDIILRLSDYTGHGFSDVNLQLYKGEILGLGGLHGQGQSAVLRTLFGISPATQGIFTLNDHQITKSRPRMMIQKGCAYVSGDRGRDGIIQGRPILENITPVYNFRHKLFFAWPNVLKKRVMPTLEALKTVFANVQDSINSLSGGNQQKIVIARWLIDKPDVLFLDDPTKGVDLAAKADLFNLIRELTKGGMAIILYSSEDAELLDNSDRILVFNNGNITGELKGEQRTRFNLYQAAYGAEK